MQTGWWCVCVCTRTRPYPSMHHKARVSAYAAPAEPWHPHCPTPKGQVESARGQGWPAAACGPDLPSAGCCTAREPRVVFTPLNGWKERKTLFQGPWKSEEAIELQEHTAAFRPVHPTLGCPDAATAESGCFHGGWRLRGPRRWDIYSLTLPGRLLAPG